MNSIKHDEKIVLQVLGGFEPPISCLLDRRFNR